MAANVAQAAWCCGWIKTVDEAALWKLREEFCSNVKGATKEPNQNEYHLKTEVVNGNLHNEYAFFAHNNEDTFGDCFEATDNLITQCARAHQAHGSWEHNSQIYGMTLGDTAASNGRRSVRRFDGNIRKRSLADLPLVSTPEDVGKLFSGVFDVDGEDFLIDFHDSVNAGSAPPQGVEGVSPSDGSHTSAFQTTQGPAHSWTTVFNTTIDLQDAIRQEIASVKRRSAVRKRQPPHQCETSEAGDGKWVVLQAGEWENPMKRRQVVSPPLAFKRKRVTRPARILVSIWVPTWPNRLLQSELPSASLGKSAIISSISGVATGRTKMPAVECHEG